MRTTPGKVWLIGAGPGAPDLLTLRAVRALADADVVLIDDLVDRAVLAHCGAQVRVVAVGKRAGCRSTPQMFIHRLMLRYARQGSKLARLKGGDPFVFGRGGEELQYLRGHGIEVEAVPGLTAGIALPAGMGVPVTHRDLSHGVTLVTGHMRADAEPDWAALARTGTTLVIYMGLRRLERIAQRLIQGGMRADTPAAVIEQGSNADERRVLAPLDAIARAARDAGSRAPALIVIGDVVGLAQAADAIAPPTAVAFAAGH